MLLVVLKFTCGTPSAIRVPNSSAHVLPSAPALPFSCPQWSRRDRPGRRAGAVLVMMLPAGQRRIEHTDDAQALAVVPHDSMPVFRADAGQDIGGEVPSLAGTAIFEDAAAGTDVVGFPVMLVPEVGASPPVPPRLRDAETHPRRTW